MPKYTPIDISKVRTMSVHDRICKVTTDLAARPWTPGESFSFFLESMPDALAASDLRDLIRLIADAVYSERPVIAMMGAHVIKVGLAPVIIDLMESGILSGIALNGAGAIHDIELAYFGKTSEDVADLLPDGRFGMARETAEILNGAVAEGARESLGFGEAVGKRVVRDNPHHIHHSILGKGSMTGIPVTVHVAIGTDIVHQHPSADGAAIGSTTLRDFYIFAENLSKIHNGGVVLLFGSAVILPEVFLKALTVARNVHGNITDFTTASFDMIRHYRPHENVVRRPVQAGGRGMTFTGHHEILIPMLAAAIKEAVSK